MIQLCDVVNSLKELGKEVIEIKTCGSEKVYERSAPIWTSAMWE